MIRFLTVLFLTLSSALAELKTIVVETEFRQGNSGYFGLSLPIPARLFVQCDDEAVNKGTDSLGIYETEGAYGGLSFGTGIGFHWIPFVNTEVRVLNNWNGLRGIGFGNEDPLVSYGLIIPGYFIYAFFAAPQSWTIYPYDTSLHWVPDLQNDFYLQFNSYMFVSGLSNVGQVTLQTSGPIRYSVQ